MREEMITDLVRTWLNTNVTVYFANEYIKGRWTMVDSDSKVIGIERERDKIVYIDMDSINAIEVDKGWE